MSATDWVGVFGEGATAAGPGTWRPRPPRPGGIKPITRRNGFTMFEVLAMLLVVSVGLLAVVGLFIHANRVAAKAEGGMTGMATALSVAYDSRPYFRDPQLAAQAGWTAAPPLSTSPYAYTAKGFVNGFYVERSESSAAADILAVSGGSVDARSVRVDVDVYEALGGARVASFSTRLVRQRP